MVFRDSLAHLENSENSKSLIIVINYYSDDETIGFLKSFKDCGGGKLFNVTIVDNGSYSDRAFSDFLEDRSISIVRNDQNRGYIGGADSGLSNYLLSNSMPEWVIISNPDIRLLPEFFHVRSICSNNIGAIAPRIISTRTGRDQNPFLRSRIGRKRLAQILWFHGGVIRANLYRLLSKFRSYLLPIAADRPAVEASIYAPHGSCMILSRAYFERGGTLSYGAFLFCEELHIAEICRRVGLPIIYRPDLVVYHKEHATTGWLRRSHMVKLQADALRFCLKEYWRY